MGIIAEMQLEPQHVLGWLAVGLIAGWLAGWFMKGGGYGIVGDLVIGLLGAVIGGALFIQVAGGPHGLAESVFVAFLGACMLLGCVRVLAREHVGA